MTKIKWLGNMNELPYLFKNLIEQGIIPKIGNINKLICLHFTNRYGLDLDVRSVRTSKSKSIGVKAGNTLDNIIERIVETEPEYILP